MLVFTVINLKRYHAPYFNYLLLGTNKFDVKNNLKVKIKLCSSVIHRSTRSHRSNLSYRPSLLSCYSRVARARVDVEWRALASMSRGAPVRVGAVFVVRRAGARRSRYLWHIYG